jgi:hypothetical protein
MKSEKAHAAWELLIAETVRCAQHCKLQLGQIKVCLCFAVPLSASTADVNLHCFVLECRWTCSAVRRRWSGLQQSAFCLPLPNSMWPISPNIAVHAFSSRTLMQRWRRVCFMTASRHSLRQRRAQVWHPLQLWPSGTHRANTALRIRPLPLPLQSAHCLNIRSVFCLCVACLLCSSRVLIFVLKDDSDLTINVCLRGESTSGSQIMFDGGRTSFRHRSGHGVMHAGATRHSVIGAADGSRWNLLFFVRRAAQ